MMIDVMCQLGWAMGYPESRSGFLAISVGVFLVENNI